MLNRTLLIELLKREVLPTMGCTEPGAVALAVAQASETLAGDIERIDIAVNANVYKNGMAVGIPGTGETGLEIAAALGAIKKSPEKQLAVLSEVTADELIKAKAMLADGMVKVSINEAKNSLWIQARVVAGASWSQVIIKDKHTNIVSIQKNGVYILDREQADDKPGVDHRAVLRGEAVTIADIIEAVETIPWQDLSFLLEGVDMNYFAAELGLAKRLGMGIGAELEKMTRSGLLADDIVNYAKKLTAAAADARMSGENVAIMSSAGSGNHGITVIIPVYAVAQKVNAPQERLIRAIAISHLITIYIKNYTGSLSALCGCAVAAASGASAAITWLMGGSIGATSAAIKNVIANITGMICDGGKVGCALKLSTAAATAVESSLLAQSDIIVPCTNGIITDTVEGTIRNLGRVSNPGMLQTDKVVIEVMLEKGGRKSVS